MDSSSSSCVCVLLSLMLLHHFEPKCCTMLCTLLPPTVCFYSSPCWWSPRPGIAGAFQLATSTITLSSCRFVDAPAALGYAPLHMACGHGHRGAVAALLEGGADPRVRCIGKMYSSYLMPQRYKPAATPLHIAGVSGNLGICITLLRSQVRAFYGL